MNDPRSEVYFFQFNTQPDKSIEATGIQFVTQTIHPPADEVSFSTLKKADDDGHMKALVKCFPGYQVLKEIAALPNKISRAELLDKIRQWRTEAQAIMRK